MMGLAKMPPEGWAYYAREVAAGVEDYFVGRGEEAGRWIGRAAEGLGLSGEVAIEGLSLLFGQGWHPVTGAALGRRFGADKGVVAGYALSFSPPKSVSVLWALAPSEMSSEVRAGHDAAVIAALEFLEDHAGFCRRGHGGAVQESTSGYVGAVFVHRSSRAGDPQLHSHVLVANKVRAGSDGRWLTLDGRELFEVQKAAGMLYKAALRAELTARLGVGWGAVDDNGGAEIAGVPDRLIGLFSKRRAQVEAVAARLVGEREQALRRSLTRDERAGVFQLAAYRSRAAKADGPESTNELRARWRAEAAAIGDPPEEWIGDLARSATLTARETRVARLGVARTPEVTVAEVIDVLETHHSTWGRSEVIAAASAVLPAHRAGNAEAARRVLEATADVVLASADVIGLTGSDRHGGRRYTTRWTLQTEQAVLDTIEPGRHAGVGVVAEQCVEAAVAGLGDDQAAAVRRLCGGGERVAVLVGPAGSGKTATLGAARQAWQTAGIPVRGVAPSAIAAGVLGEQAGIASDTLARFLHQASRGQLRLRAGEVIVCDEAFMVATRDLAQLVLLAETAGAKVVLVGDHYQLGSVDAGGLFRLLAADAHTTELTTVRRFNHPWEADATRRLRQRDPTVIDDYIDRGRVQSGRREHALDIAHHAWEAARQQGRSVVVTAADHDTVDQLAMRARAARVAAGQVQPDGVPIGAQTVGVGDEIVTTRNDRRLVTTTGAWVRNGDRWHITNRHPAGSLQLASLTGRGTVTVPASYVTDHVALAYAVTVHKAQGVTVDHAVLVVDRATTAEHLYVGMTRGRHHNQACVIAEPAGDEHTHIPAPTPAQVLAGAMRKTSSEKSATETLREELDHLDQAPPHQPAAAILDGLRRTQQHSYHETIRRPAQRQVQAYPAPSPAPPITTNGSEL